MLRLLVRNALNRSSQLRRQVSTASYTLTERQPSNSPIWIRAQSESSLLKGVSPTDFQLYTNVFSKEEQTELLKCALKRLDEIRGVSRTIKKRRKEAVGVANAIGASEPPADVQSQFLPDTCYEFDEGHYDGVIHQYRESHVSAWPESARGLLSKAGLLIPGSPSLSSVQTHALHLASDGEIQSHVDNIEASGKTILGISLGAARVLRLQPKEPGSPDECVDILLESGSVYVQTGFIRYGFVHSIPLEWQFRETSLKPGQRMSIMLRDLYASSSSSPTTIAEERECAFVVGAGVWEDACAELKDAALGWLREITACHSLIPTSPAKPDLSLPPFLSPLVHSLLFSTMNTLRVARTLQPQVLASSRMLVRAASTTTHTSAASSIIPVSNIEAQWETLNTKEQTEVYEQLLEAQKRDWKTLSIDEKKAAYYISFGPHGPRKPVDEPGSGLKVFGLTVAIVGAACVAFLGIRSFGGEPPRTMTKEWQEASNELAREEKQNPLTGITSEGYKGKGHVSLK